MARQNFAELFASRMLADEGLAAVWRLHIAAAIGYRQGHIEEAETILTIADAAERQWTGRGTQGV
jgi:hypothetical protein